MSVTPVDSSVVSTQSQEASFDAAVSNAQQSPEDAKLMDEMMVQGMTTLAQTVLMPRMNEILSEAQSDE